MIRQERKYQRIKSLWKFQIYTETKLPDIKKHEASKYDWAKTLDVMNLNHSAMGCLHVALRSLHALARPEVFCQQQQPQPHATDHWSFLSAEGNWTANSSQTDTSKASLHQQTHPLHFRLDVLQVYGVSHSTWEAKHLSHEMSHWPLLPLSNREDCQGQKYLCKCRLWHTLAPLKHSHSSP